MHHCRAKTNPERTYPSEHSYSPYFYSRHGLHPCTGDLLFTLTGVMQGGRNESGWVMMGESLTVPLWITYMGDRCQQLLWGVVTGFRRR